MCNIKSESTNKGNTSLNGKIKSNTWFGDSGKRSMRLSSYQRMAEC